MRKGMCHDRYVSHSRSGIGVRCSAAIMWGLAHSSLRLPRTETGERPYIAEILVHDFTTSFFDTCTPQFL